MAEDENNNDLPEEDDVAVMESEEGDGDEDIGEDDWGAALAEQGDGDDDWGAALAEQGVEEIAEVDWNIAGSEAAIGGSADRIFSQDEIDSLLGFSPDFANESGNGIRAIIDSALVSYERLPMLEIVFDRLVRLMTSSLRNFTSDSVEVSLDSISSVRFGDYLNSIPLPAILSVFKAVEWDNYGLFTVDSNLIYSIVDSLLGGRRGNPPARIEGRPYTTIETVLVERMIEVVLQDAEAAFEPISPVNFEIDRLETNPRFAAIARNANAAILVKLRIDMEDRGGRIEMLIPYGTIEPIRELLLQGFMGEKFGRDAIWETHLAGEIWDANLEIDAVLDELQIPLKDALELEVGQTFLLSCDKNATIDMRCGGISLMKGKMGRLGENMAVQISQNIDEAQLMKSVERSQEMSEMELA